MQSTTGSAYSRFKVLDVSPKSRNCWLWVDTRLGFLFKRRGLLIKDRAGLWIDFAFRPQTGGQAAHSATSRVIVVTSVAAVNVNSYAAAPMQHDYERLVAEALSNPGRIHAAYSALHEFSLGNQWLAMIQIDQAEPIATFMQWKEIGQNVRKGAKAIELIMPVFKKTKTEVTGQDEERIFFIARRHWFPLSRTEGAEYVPTPLPDFDINRALLELNIKEEPFQAMSGNSMGYAKTNKRTIAVSPLAFDPLKTKIHEAAHVILHTDLFSSHPANAMPRDVKEIEAETTSYLVCSALGHTVNLHYARGYISSWLNDKTLDKVRFSRVYASADEILRAGRIKPTEQKDLSPYLPDLSINGEAPNR